MVGAALRRAIGIVGLSDKEAADLLVMDKSQLSRWLAGTETIQLHRIYRTKLHGPFCDRTGAGRRRLHRRDDGHMERPVMERLITLADVAARYAVSTRTARRMVARHDGSIAPPCRLRPLRWRVSDVDRHLRTMTVTDQLQREVRA